MVDSVGDIKTVSVSECVTPIMLDSNEEPDPHAWMSVSNVKLYVENILEDLIERDPDGESTYCENAEAYLAELDELETFI